MIQRISQLSEELEDAQKTIAFLENINVPNLIKELLEKHFNSRDAVKKFLKPTTPTCQTNAVHQPDVQSPALKADGTTQDWSGVGHSESEAMHQRVTAFLPWKQEGSGGEDGGARGHPSSDSPELPFSVADISLAIYKKMAANQGRFRPVIPQTGHPSTGTDHHGNPPPNPYPLAGVKGGEGVGSEVRGAEMDPGALDVSYLSAQRILDDFMHQLRSPEEESGKKVDCDSGDCNL